MKSLVLTGVVALSFGCAFGHVASAQAENELSSTGKASTEYVQLRLNLEPGAKYRMTSATQTKITIVTPPMKSQPAQKVEISGVAQNVLSYDILYNNPDGTTQTRLTYGNITNKMTMKVDGKTQAMPADSSSKALFGQSVEMKISPEGEVSDVRGLDNIWKRAFDASKTPGVTPQMQKQLQDSMKKMFGESFMKKIMQQAGLMFPENPVRIGDSWTRRIEPADNCHLW